MGYENIPNIALCHYIAKTIAYSYALSLVVYWFYPKFHDHLKFAWSMGVILLCCFQMYVMIFRINLEPVIWYEPDHPEVVGDWYVHHKAAMARK